MANVSYETNQIKTAIYGEEVRDAIISAIRKVASETTDTSALVDQLEAELSERISRNSAAIAIKGDNLYFDEEEKLLYLMSDGQVIGDGIAVSTGGGGGGGGQSMYFYKPTLTNQLPDRNITTTSGTEVNLRFSYTSVDDQGADDGPGVGRIVVGGTTKRSFKATQGNNVVEISDVLEPGANTVQVKVENSEGTIRTLNYTVTVVVLLLTTTMNEITDCRGVTKVYYTVTGSGEKTVHFELDGTEIGTETVMTSGRSRSYDIDEQTHGSHILEIYATSTADNLNLESERLRLCLYWIGNESTPIIATPFNTSAVTEGDTISIPYAVYDPSTELATVTLSVIDGDGEVYSTNTITKDRSVGDPWIINNYPSGNIRFRISCNGTVKDIPVAVEPYTFPISKVTDSLALEFSPEGRSNNESNPESWSYGNDISATFSGFGWGGSDGWMNDDENVPILRFLPGDTMEINFMPFEEDVRRSGYTIEVDFATRDIRDFATVVVDCTNNGRGFRISSTQASLTSEQSAVSMQYNENARIRATFVIEQNTENRLIYIYINGIMCAVTQYPSNDDFSQQVAQTLSIGSNACGLDLYGIRCYTKDLSSNEQLDNYIVDQPTLMKRREMYDRNNILNQYGNIVIEQLPTDLPYMVFSGPELPQAKGDKKTMTVTFIDPVNSSRSFVAEGCQVDCQGTTSSKYPVKNLKFKAKNGFTNNGVTSDKYELRPGDIPVNEFCIKVDFASSENANNVVLVQLYEDICREQGYTTAPQEEDARVRQGIAGRPIVVFWNDTVHNETVFVAKGNFNNDKGTRETFGFDLFPGSESWEFKNNTTTLSLFQGSDLSPGKWEDDFEAREPDKYTDTTKLQRVFQFVASHNRDTVSTQVEKDEMLADFKAHFEDYFVLNNMLFFYLFTEFFLMIDNRAKNMFLTTYDGTHWFSLPYDFDTALGIDNDGLLVYDYYLEDTDYVNGDTVFNGQNSVLWMNVRDAFADELKAMYKRIRSGQFLQYDVVKQRFLAHQSAWPERLWNEDAWKKYIETSLANINSGAIDSEDTEERDYMPRLQGNKASQRDYWLYGAFKYRDSKYETGDSQSKVIVIRGYTDEAHPISSQNLTITPYADIYSQVQFASYKRYRKLARNETYTFVNPMSNMSNTEIYIYSADRIADVGDLSPMNLGSADFSAATKLNQLIIGSSAQGYTNTHLNSLVVGNNKLLKLLNVCNCVALTNPVNLSRCTGIETVLAKGSATTGFQLPVGGHLTRLELPATVTNLTVQNQSNLTTFEMEGYTSLSTLRIENTPNIPLETIINGATNLARVRLMGIEWTATDETALQTTINRLKTCRGLDVNDNTVDNPVVNGRVNISSISSALLIDIQNSFQDLVVVVNGHPQYVVHYQNYDGTVLYNQVVVEGGNASDPITGGQISTPERPDDPNGTSYVFASWTTLPTDIHANSVVTAQYTAAYTVNYVNDNGTVLQTKKVTSGQSTSYTGSTPTKASTAQYTYAFKEWSGADDSTAGKQSGTITQVNGPRTVTATFTSTVRSYTATFYAENRSTVLQSSQVAYGNSASYTGSTPVSQDGYAFEGWEPSSMVITANTNFYPKFTSPIEDVEISDTWDTIVASLEAGSYATKYKVGNYKPLDVGTEGTVNMQIVAMDDEKGPLTFVAKELLKTQKQMNSTATNANGYPATDVMKPWLDQTIYPLLPAAVNNAVKLVTLKSYDKTTGGDITHTEKLWIPSAREIFGGSSYEQSGPVYTGIYKDAASIKKMVVGSSSYAQWWLRSAIPNYGASFRYVTNYGGMYYTGANSSSGVCLGFTLSAETISDSWSEIAAAVANNTYKTKYSVGNTKLLDLGDQGNILMQIAAFDADELADGSGTAAITWVAKQLLVTKKQMNSTGTNANGYPASAMKTYLEGTIWGKIPSTVQALIQTVKKTSYDKTTAADLTSNLKVWIPSAREIFGGRYYEQSGPVYSALFVDANSRKKKVYGLYSANYWWLRSANSGNDNGFRVATSSGTENYTIAYDSHGVCLGFCTGVTPTT